MLSLVDGILGPVLGLLFREARTALLAKRDAHELRWWRYANARSLLRERQGDRRFRGTWDGVAVELEMPKHSHRAQVARIRSRRAPSLDASASADLAPLLAAPAIAARLGDIRAKNEVTYRRGTVEIVLHAAPEDATDLDAALDAIALLAITATSTRPYR